jgi:hypothetical protein
VGGSGIGYRVSKIWFFVVALLATASHVSSQELVPAAYTPAPYGVNLLTFATQYRDGDVTFDPSLPIEDASAWVSASSVGYARTLSIGGQSANIGVVVPYVVGHIEGILAGDFAFADRSGLGDLGLRFAVNLYGAPAMSPKEFQSFKPRTMIGTSLTVIAPTGEYDPSKLINISTNRWAFKPEIGVVHVMGRWALDAYLGGSFFTDNTDFYGGSTREQDPIFSAQIHARYLFKPGLWGAVDGNFWQGGQSTVDGNVNDDEQRNSRVGLTVSISLGRSQSLRIAASRGAITRIGGDFGSIGVSYGYSWLTAPKGRE